MHSSAPHQLARLARAALLLALIACDHSPTDPTTRVHALQPMNSMLRVKAGAVVYPSVLLLDGNGGPVAGAHVSWSASAGGISTSSVSGDDGVAAARWYAPTELGSVSVTASVGDAPPLELHSDVIAADAAKLDVLDDSVRFTAQRQTRVVRIVGQDAYGHPALLDPDQLGFRRDSDWVGVAGVTSGDTALVELSVGSGTHRGYVWFKQDSLLVISQPVVTRLSEISGLDSVNGLAIGERGVLKVIGIDSLGYEIIGVDPVAAGLQLSTSDANVASVSNDGTITGVAAGKVTIDASAPGVTYRQDIAVYPAFDLGTQKASIGLLDQQAHVQLPVDQFLTDAGTLYELETLSNHTATNMALRAHSADGRVAWTRSYPGFGDAVADPVSGVVYMVDEVHVIHAIEPSGMDRWSFDYGTISTERCQLATWRSGVAAGCGTRAFALNGDRSLAWSATVDDTVRQIISAPALTVLRMQHSVVALHDGSVAWTRQGAAADMIANDASTVYLVENGVRAIDVDGTERWYNTTPLGGCILATAERIVVCRNYSVITALDPADGHVRWTATSPAPFGGMVAISGDRILTAGAYLFAFDARNGAVLGRSFDRLDEYNLSVGPGVMAAASVSLARVFSTSFSPGSEWAQNAGNAGHGNQVSP